MGTHQQDEKISLFESELDEFIPVGASPEVFPVEEHIRFFHSQLGSPSYEYRETLEKSLSFPRIAV